MHNPGAQYRKLCARQQDCAHRAPSASLISNTYIIHILYYIYIDIHVHIYIFVCLCVCVCVCVHVHVHAQLST